MQIYPLRICILTFGLVRLHLLDYIAENSSGVPRASHPVPSTFSHALTHSIFITLSNPVCFLKFACPFQELVLLGPIFRTNECLQWLLFSAQCIDWAGGLHFSEKSRIPNGLPIRPGVHASVGISDLSRPPPLPALESEKLGWC